MEYIAPEVFGNRDETGLLRFLEDCAARAVVSGEGILGSISLQVGELDPLAVLQSIFEPDEDHLYLENPAGEFALAGAETVVGLELRGEDRFRLARQWMGRMKDRLVQTGDRVNGLDGPAFLWAMPFSGASRTTGKLFVPRWQVIRRGGYCVATANLWITSASFLKEMSERVWRAHSRFSKFSYRTPPAESAPVSLEGCRVVEVGGPRGFRDRVAVALRAIDAGQFNKVVLGRSLDFEGPEDFRPLDAVHRLRETFPACYAFSHSTTRGESWVGASPERLVAVTGDHFETEAIAGSTPRGTNSQDDAQLGSNLLTSAKDLGEHRFVVEAILKRLTSLGLAEVTTEPLRLIRLANVQHLKTPISGTKPPGGLIVLAEALHPTPAVGGTPREEALRFISNEEPFDRGHYTGFFGYLRADGEGLLVVTLRCGKISGNRATLFAGAGIVADSTPEAEEREIEMKFEAMRKGLG
ncbi:MAG: isochorismate synthase MenF [Puniceicoccaceae bacterium]